MTATLSPGDALGVSRRYISQDDETRRWVAKSWQPDRSVSRKQLLTYAQKRIAELTRPDAPGRALGWAAVHSAIASLTMSILGVLVNDDDVATPQIAPTPDGGIDVEWLVSGDSLSVTADLDGISIVGQFDNGDYAFEPYSWDFHGDAEGLRKVLHSASSFLEGISAGIQYRFPVR